MRQIIIISSFLFFICTAIARADITSALDNAYCVGVSSVHLETNEAILNLNNISFELKRQTELNIQKIKAEIDRRAIFIKAYLSSAPEHRSAIVSMIEQGDKDQRMCLGALVDSCPTNNQKDFFKCGDKAFEKFCPVKTRKC